jgi:hypothetical protein
MEVESFKHRQLAPTVGPSSRSSGEFGGPSSAKSTLFLLISRREVEVVSSAQFFRKSIRWLIEFLFLLLFRRASRSCKLRRNSLENQFGCLAQFPCAI